MFDDDDFKTIRELSDRLVDRLEKGDESEIKAVVGDLTRLHDHSLFQELGRMTREFHDSLNAYEKDNFSHELAGTILPDAGARLQNVMDMSNDAAHRTIEAVERVKSSTSLVSSQLGDWVERGGEKGKGLFEPVQQLVAEIDKSSTEILLAQEYQDLMGQVLKKVITLVNGVHISLAKLLGEAAHVSGAEGDASRELSADAVEVSSQEEVDDLLASLGF